VRCGDLQVEFTDEPVDSSLRSCRVSQVQSPVAAIDFTFNAAIFGTIRDLPVSSWFAVRGFKAAIWPTDSPLHFICIQVSELKRIRFFEGNWHDLLLSAILLSAAIAISLVAHLIVFWLLRQFAHRKAAVLDQSLIRHDQGPTRWIFPLLAALAVLPGLPLPPISETEKLF
jgi:hypothetical protein